MDRRSATRLVAGLLAAVGGLSVPTAALAHGIAHGREAHAHVAERHADAHVGTHVAAATGGEQAHEAGETPAHAPTTHAPTTHAPTTHAPVAHSLADHDREPGLSSSHDASDHAHPQVGRAVSTSGRMDLPTLAALPAIGMTPAIEIVLVVSAALRLTTAPPRAGPAQVAPPPSRAPPIA